MSSRKSILRSSHGIPRPLSAKSTKSNEIPAEKVLKRKIPEIRATKKVPDDMLDLSNVDLSLMSRKNSDFSKDQIEAIVDEQKNETKMYFSTPIKTKPAVDDATYDVISSLMTQETPKVSFTRDEFSQFPDLPLEKASETEETVVNGDVIGDFVSSREVSRTSDENPILLLPSLSFIALVALNTLVLLYFYDRIIALEKAVFTYNPVLKKENTNLIVYSEDSFWEMMISAIFKFYGVMLEALTSFNR